MKLEGTRGSDVIVGSNGGDKLHSKDADGGGDWIPGYWNTSKYGGSVWVEGHWEDPPDVTDAADTILGGGGSDKIYGYEGDDSLDGGSGADCLFGGADADTLDGGTGKDAMAGNTGDDVYLVDSAKDKVNEVAGEGVDTVVSAVSYKLPNAVENLTLVGAAVSGTGNDAANLIRGNAGNNALSGQGGDDTLVGGVGADTATGGAGADRFAFEAPGEGVDRIADFSVAAGDVLDFGVMLVGYVDGVSDPALFVQLAVSEGNTVVRVDADGGGNGFQDICVLQGVAGLTVAGLLSSGNLDLVA
jgi:Ca2+-binding RTX toxin-like protein